MTCKSDPMKIIAIGNQKGGVGKTTTTLNLGYSLVERERRVLMVDLDPQASLTAATGIDDCAGRSLAEVLTGHAKLADILQVLPSGLILAPSDIALSESELVLAGKIGREAAVKRALSKLGRRFDYVLLDLPPSLGLLTINGLAAAGSVLVPAIPQYLDLRALAIFTRTLELVREEINPGLALIGILPTFYDSRLRLHGEILQAWEAANLPVLPLRVKRSVRIAESPVGGQPVAVYSTSHAEVYRQLAELIDHD
jgi:chromosome partitioning protein